MSVESVYLAVQWSRLLDLSRESLFIERLMDAAEYGELWVRRFPFGKQVTRDRFESRDALSQFEDWFGDVRTRLAVGSAPNVQENNPNDQQPDLRSPWRRRLGRWFARNRIPGGQRKAMQSLHELFVDFGLIHQGQPPAFRAIRKQVKSEDPWLVGAIPPEDVRSLRLRAAAIDRRQLQAWFNTALAMKPCRVVQSGRAAAAWLDALSAGFDDTAAKGEGVILGIEIK